MAFEIHSCFNSVFFCSQNIVTFAFVSNDEVKDHINPQPEQTTTSSTLPQLQQNPSFEEILWWLPLKNKIFSFPNVNTMKTIHQKHKNQHAERTAHCSSSDDQTKTWSNPAVPKCPRNSRVEIDCFNSSETIESQRRHHQKQKRLMLLKNTSQFFIKWQVDCVSEAGFLKKRRRWVGSSSIQSLQKLCAKSHIHD